jgi:hypothetical protein
MKRYKKNLAFAAFLVTPMAVAAECSKPPVHESMQAMCYAVAYADKHGLKHGQVFKRSVAKGQHVWTVRFLNDREGSPQRGWEVDIDTKNGKVVRFLSYRPVPPIKS